VKTVFGGGGASAPAIAVGVGFWLLAGGAYLTLFWGIVGQTPGMRFLGIRLIVDGEPGGIGARRAVRRLLALPLAALPLGAGFLGIVTRDSRQGFHDRAAGTEVGLVPDLARAPWSARPPSTVSAE
jgi:uncharacterized RDD family membrane protein YckC